jgi:VIT1/CCC1 family predicted Fe2+/Mn2+ transporter
MHKLGPEDIRANLDDERASAYLYLRLEAAETGKAAQLFASLRGESDKQAAIWEAELRKAGESSPVWRPSARVRLVGWLVGRLGPRRMLPVLSAMKVRGLAIYRGGGLVEGDNAEAPSAEGPAAIERRGSVAEESWHRAASGGGALRAAVFGVNDGLVSNASLIIGVAGADPDPKVIVLAGVAGLLAGGFSMAAGEYISVRTQRELLEHQIALERDEILQMPEEEIEELALIYRAKGLDPGQAETLARRIVLDPVRGLDTLAREELGLDPQGLASPVAAAVASFLSFSLGALVPLVPYLVSGGPAAFAGTILFTLVGLLTVGGLMSLFTGRSLWWSAVRMALIGSAAAAATFAIGKLLGVSVS